MQLNINKLQGLNNRALVTAPMKSNGSFERQSRFPLLSGSQISLFRSPDAAGYTDYPWLVFFARCVLWEAALAWKRFRVNVCGPVRLIERKILQWTNPPKHLNTSVNLARRFNWCKFTCDHGWFQIRQLRNYVS